MKIYLPKYIIFAFCTILFAEDDYKFIERVINQTDKQYKKVFDFQVEMQININVPGFRMPKKKFKVFFKQPDKIKFNTKGFGVLPKTGLFTSPLDNFDNLRELEIFTDENIDPNNVIISGKLITDSLKVKMPNEYARLTFIPTVDVKIDTKKWVINKVTTKIDTLKIMEISNLYDQVDSDYYLPKESNVKYYVKDAKLSKWLNKDISSAIGSNMKPQSNDMVEGNIKILYSKYKINRGIPDRIFKSLPDKDL